MRDCIDAQIETPFAGDDRIVVVTFPSEAVWQILEKLDALRDGSIAAVVIRDGRTKMRICAASVRVVTPSRRIVLPQREHFIEVLWALCRDKANNAYPRPHADLELDGMDFTFQWTESPG